MDEISGQCNGTTKKNVRCKNKGKYSNPESSDCFCSIHIKKETENCVICLSPLYDVFELECGHRFHSRCVLNWFRYKNTCPICRQIILDDDDFSIYNDILSNISEIYLHVAIDIEFESNNSNVIGNHSIELEFTPNHDSN